MADSRKTGNPAAVWRKAVAIASLFAIGLATSLLAQSDEAENLRPRVNTQMHGDAAGAPAPDPDSVIVPKTLSAPSYFGQLAFDKKK